MPVDAGREQRHRHQLQAGEDHRKAPLVEIAAEACRVLVPAQDHGHRDQCQIAQQDRAEEGFHAFANVAFMRRAESHEEAAVARRCTGSINPNLNRNPARRAERRDGQPVPSRCALRLPIKITIRIKSKKRHSGTPSESERCSSVSDVTQRREGAEDAEPAPDEVTERCMRFGPRFSVLGLCVSAPLRF